MASDEPTMLFYDENGKRVAEGSPAVRRQFLSDDPARPDAPPEERPTSNVFGLRTSAPVAMHYYDADGKRVAEGSGAAVRQFAANDPARPDAPASGSAVVSRETSGSKSEKKSTPDATDDADPLAARRALVARAKELGIPATGKTPELTAAVAAAEGKAKSGPDETKARTGPDETKDA